MASKYFFAKRINIISGSFDLPLQAGHEKFQPSPKVPVDRRTKKSNDMTVEVAPAEENVPPRLHCRNAMHAK